MLLQGRATRNLLFHQSANNGNCNQNPASRCPNFVDLVSR